MSPERAITLLRRPRPELMRRPWADGPTSVLRRPRCGRSRVKSEPIEFPSASWQPHIPLDSRLCLALVLSNSSLLCTTRSWRDCALPTCRRLFHLTNQRANELIRWCCLLRLSCSSRLSSTAPPLSRQSSACCYWTSPVRWSIVLFGGGKKIQKERKKEMK